MKLSLILGLSLLVAAAAMPAAAAPFGYGGYFRPYVQNQQPSRFDQRREADRPAPRREMPQREMPRREMRPAPDTNRGRMSPDERRQLRRDIQDAGRDIYQRDRQAPRREQRR